MKILSLGVGVQSVTLYKMSSLGILPKVDYAIFADPGAEENETYEYLEYLKKWQIDNNGVLIIHSKLKDTIEKDLLQKTNSTGQRFASIPAFTLGEERKGQLRRQCTNEYKIVVVNKEIRRLYGLKKYARYPITEVWVGITLDEAIRATTDSKEKWKIKIYPFLNLGGKFFDKPLTRQECIYWLIEHGYPVPPKSACYFCPYQGDRRLLYKKQNKPELWKKIINVDASIRGSSIKGITHPLYLHRSCRPIDEAYLKEDQEELFGNDCTGMCGI